MSSTAKGTRAEYKSRRLLEAAGYVVVRAAASKGPFDLVAVSTVDVLLVQVKSNRPPGPAERAALAACPCPPSGKRLVHVWRDRVPKPEVREV
jgi:Holliday junction resolvase-like predicted endonuclease